MDEQDRRIGTIIDGRYELLARLGEGGMGIVYKARHVLLDKAVALKVLRDAHDAAAVERFRREAKSASMLEQENIVAITDYGVLPDSRPYLVMEFLQGPTLTEVIAPGALPALRACQIAVQIARGLQAVHEKGIIHRDLKPDNVFVLGRQGQDLIKIVDFGLAQVASGARLTAHGMVMGTAHYISPEQASGKPIDGRCDQYALGCILYEMLTGQKPFDDKSPAIVMKQHVFEFPPSLRQRRPDLAISDGLEAVVARLLLKRPEQRFGSMRDLEMALQAEIDQLLSAPTGDGDVMSRLRKARVPLALLALLSVVAIFVAVDPLRVIHRRRRPVLPPEFQPAVTEVKPPAPAAPAPAPGGDKPAAPQGPTLEVRFQVTRPARDEVSLACTPDQKQICRGHCTVTIPPGDGQCIASATGYGSQAFAYAALRVHAGKGKHMTKQKIALVPLK